MTKSINKSKKTNKNKRYPYIEVEGVANKYLDAALLVQLSLPSLELAVQKEAQLLKKAGLTVAGLRNNKYEFYELVELVSPHILETAYDLYNFLVTKWDESKDNQLLVEESYLNFTVDEWDIEIRRLLDEEALPVYVAINHLRLYKNGELKSLLIPILGEYAIPLYHETGIKLEEGFDFDYDWDEIKEGNLYVPSLFDEIDVESVMNIDELLNGMEPNVNLEMAIKIINNVRKTIADGGKLEEFKQKYELEVQETMALSTKLDKMVTDVKSKDSQIKILSKEKRDLKKDLDKVSSKLEVQKKESGKLGQDIGELRIENETLQKTNNTLERKVKSLETAKAKVVSLAEKEVKKEYDSRIIQLTINHDNATNQLERQINEYKGMLEKEQAKNEVLSGSLEIMQKELDASKEVADESVSTTFEKEKESDIGEDSDDIMFGFNEDEIEDFVEFNNRPTKN